MTDIDRELSEAARGLPVTGPSHGQKVEVLAKLEQITSLDGSVRDKERLTLRLPLDARAAAVPRPVPAAKDLKPHPATLLLIDGRGSA